MARHCPECGFVVTEGANYCPKCGAFLGAEQTKEDVTTATYVIDERTGELKPVDVGDVAAESGALVIRAGAALRRITFSIRDRGSLYSLEDGDELQIGKYKLTYLAR